MCKEGARVSGTAAFFESNNTQVVSCRGVHRRVGGSGWRLFGAKRSYSKGVGGGPVGSCWMWWFGVYRSQVVTCKCLLMGFLYHVLVGCGLSCSGRKVLKPCRVVAGKRCKHPRRRRRCQRSRLGVLYRFGKTWWTWLCQIFARSCSNVQTPVQHPAGLNTVLRGGGSAGGVSATKRKRKEKAAQQEVLNKLCNFLGTLLGPTAAAPQVQASKTRKKKKKKKQTDRPQTVSGESAMERLNKVVEEIRLHPASLVTRLESFVAAVKSEESVRKASITDARQGTWADTVKSGSGPGNAPAKKVNTVVTLSRHHFPPGSVCEFSQVLRKLEQGESPLGTVAVAPSLAKALEARQLAHAHKLDSLKFACVVDGVDLLQLPEGVTTVTLPVSSLAQSVARHTRFHNMACVLLGAEAPLLPTGLVKEVKVSLPARELATVRFHVPSAFLSKEQWSLWKVKASSLVQEWATKSVVIHSSYGWAVTSQANWKEEKEEFVIGYAKVPLGELEHLLGRSGRSGVFVDRIVKECPTKQFVSWVDRSDLEHVAYLKKVLGQAAAQGVAVVWRPGGGQALGLKLKQAPTEGVVSVWRAKGAPFGWTEDDLFQVLEGAGWSQLSIVAYPTKKIRPWLLKAKPPGLIHEGIAGVQVGRSLVTLERAAARAVVKRESKKLVTLPRTQHAAAAVPGSVLEVSEVADTQIELDEEDPTEPGDVDMSGGALKRVGGTPGSAEHARKKEKREDKSSVSRQLVYPGFKVQDCGADGACGFNCIAIGAALMRGSVWEEVKNKCGVMGTTLRVQVSQHIGKNAADYKPLWSPDVSGTSTEKEDGEVPTDWNSWLLAIRRHKRWICGLTIKGAATRLGIKIIVVLKQKDGSWGLPMAFGVTRKKENPIVIGLDEAAGHYVLLIPDSPDAVPGSWLHAGQCEVTMTSQLVLRGAGRSTGSSSDKAWLPPSTPQVERGSDGSVCSKWMPPHTPAPSTIGVHGVDRWLPSATPSHAPACSRAAGTAFGSVEVDARSYGPVVNRLRGKQSVPLMPEVRPGSCVHTVGSVPSDSSAPLFWDCMRCGKRVVARSFAQLARRRVGHLAIHSQNSCRSDGQVAVKVGPEPFVWTCHLCNERFESSSSVALTDKRSNHLGVRHPEYTPGVNLRRTLVDVVQTSPMIPPEQRGWTCVWCGEGLPELPKWQKGKSITAHLKKRHGRKKTDAAASNRARGKMFRQNKNANPVMRDGKLSLGRKLRQRGNSRRNWQEGGHDLVEVVGVDWQSWHDNSIKKRLGAGGDTLLTCRKCLLIRRAQNKFEECRGNRQVNTPQMVMWDRLSEPNRRAVLDVWQISLQEAQEIFNSARASWRANPTQKGHDIIEVVGKKKYLTCRKCWFVRIGLGALGQCKGRRDFPTKSQVRTWNSFHDQLSLKKGLADVWGVSVKVASTWYKQPLPQGKRRRPAASKHAVQDSWQHDVVEDGDVHPHPGPCVVWRCVSLNVGGLPGAWKALDEWLVPSKVMVLALQEVRGSPNQIAALRSAALKNGYRLYHVCGKSTVGGWGEDRQCGGVSLFVRSSLRQRPAFALCGEACQCVAAWVDGWLMCSAYAPPRQDHEAQVELGSCLLDGFATANVVVTQPWLVCGDFNELVGNSTVEACLCTFGGVACSVNQPTRWEGARCVDWFVTNRPRSLGLPRLLSICISDHIPQEIVVNKVPREVQVGRLLATVNLQRPVGVASEVWEAYFLDCWTQNAEVQAFNAALQEEGPIFVQSEWDTFQKLLVRASLSTYERLSQLVSLPVQTRDACVKGAGQKPFKGEMTRYVSMTPAHARVRHEVGDMAIPRQPKTL